MFSRYFVVFCLPEEVSLVVLFKKTLIENMKPNKISFNNISVKNQQIKTNRIVKNNIEFLNDKRYISNINEDIPHTLYIE